MGTYDIKPNDQYKLERMENRLAFRQAKEQARTGHTPSIFLNPNVNTSYKQVKSLEPQGENHVQR